MTWILGFGIPFGYLIVALTMGRIIYPFFRSRDFLDEDTMFATTAFSVLWPISIPIFIICGIGYLFYQCFHWFITSGDRKKEKAQKAKEEKYDQFVKGFEFWFNEWLKYPEARELHRLNMEILCSANGVEFWRMFHDHCDEKLVDVNGEPLNAEKRNRILENEFWSRGYPRIGTVGRKRK